MSKQVKNHFWMTLCVCAAAVLVASSPWNKVRASSDNGKDGPVGSYVWSFLGVGPGLHVPGLTTLTSDGTLLAITGSDQGGPSSVFLVKNSATHGVWSRTGARSVDAKAYFLNFDPGSGVVIGITRVRIHADFTDNTFNHGSGVFYDSVFLCATPFTCPDPLTATPNVPEPTVGRPFTADRITAVQ